MKSEHLELLMKWIKMGWGWIISLFNIEMICYKWEQRDLYHHHRHRGKTYCSKKYKKKHKQLKHKINIKTESMNNRSALGLKQLHIHSSHTLRRQAASGQKERLIRSLPQTAVLYLHPEGRGASEMKRGMWRIHSAFLMNPLCSTCFRWFRSKVTDPFSSKYLFLRVT